MQALEDESHGGPTNNTLSTAQDISSSFISLSAGSAERGAAIGQVGLAMVGSDSVDFYSFT